MPPLFNASVCDMPSNKAGAYDLSLYLRHTCVYQSLRLSRSLGCRPVARPFQTELSRGALWVPLARPLSAAIPLSGRRSVSRLERSPIQVRSIWANPCGKRAAFAARCLADRGDSRSRLLVLNADGRYGCAIEALKRARSNRGETRCEPHIFWQARPFWRSQLAATQPLNKARLVPEQAQVRPSSQAVTWSPVQPVALRSTSFTARQIRANATTQARRFKRSLTQNTGALALTTIGKGAALGCTFSRLWRPSHV